MSARTGKTDPSGHQSIAEEMTVVSMEGVLAGVATLAFIGVTQRDTTPFRLYHYTTLTNAYLIETSGFLAPGLSGFNFFTDQRYDSGYEARDRLALFTLADQNLVPTVRISITLYNPSDFVLGPFPVVGGRARNGIELEGGGREYISGKPLIFARQPNRMFEVEGIHP